jgi:hypothetical protein
MFLIFVFQSFANAALVNLAHQFGDASQSSTYTAGDGVTGYANKAIDNDTSGDWADLSISHTSIEPKPYWEVNLGGSYAIDSIILWNRTDGNAEAGRFKNFDITILNSSGGVAWTDHCIDVAGASTLFDPTVIIWGEKVRVQLRDTNYLTLAEVQVFGDPELNPVPLPASVFLLSFGLLGLSGMRRKQRKE